MKKKKKGIVILSVFVVLIGVLSYMLFSKNGYKNYTSGQSFGSLVDVLLETGKGKENIEINEESINSICSTYLNEGMKKGSITITGFNADISKDKIKFLVPIKYKFLSLVLSSEGRVEAKDGNIIYTPENFKVGKIPIFKDKVMDYIGSHLNKHIKREGNKLIVLSKVFSDKIKITNIKDQKVVAQINDQGKNIASKINKATQLLDNKELAEKEVEKANKASSTNKSKSSSQKETTKGSGQSGDDSGLNGKESTMISIINSTISTVDANPSYNYWPNVNKVFSIYNSLSPSEKSRFRTKVYRFVDVDRARRVRAKLKN